MKPLLSVDGILGEHGALAAALPGFEHRPEQLEVARAVEEAFANRSYLIAEAGTGTGKTLAYLVPAILSGRRVVVSTATRNLQEQIFFKDVPLLRDVLGLEFEAAYVKGRANYLCLHRFEARAASLRFDTPEDVAAWPRIAAWAERTQTGDRAELDLPEDLPAWKDLSSTSETCLGARCPLYESCFVTRMRRRAEAADVVVANHHLFFADLALRSRPGGSETGVLPRYEAVVFDEAHAIDEVATDFFGFQVSNYRIEDLAGDAQRALQPDAPGADTLGALAARLKWHADAFIHRASVLLRFAHDGAVRLEAQSLKGAATERAQLVDALQSLHAFCAPRAEEAPELASIARRAGEIAEQLELLACADEPGHVFWAEARGRGLFLRAAPIEVGDDLRRRLYANVDTVVFTSATLTAEGRFDYFARRMGLSPADEGVPYATVSVASPFDYSAQAALYVPDHLPEPNAPGFARAVADELVALCEVTGGRAFALFTSLRNMEAAWAAAKDRLPYQVLLQGERPKRALLEAFRERPSVLFASHSFWEGVDVPGEALSLVVIDKLPFASPGDPRVAARIDLLRERGEDPFGAYQLPEAAIALRQGFGRLIRSRRDRGVVAILDPRLRARAYGRTFLRSLPPARRVDTLEALRAWFEGAGRATG
ncbi:MAG: ATP-dependent DNA helicase [Myxococcaceae bacterium]|nr:ATP-dependent DNA helicase [Myxococcaceae bacterium]